MPGTDRSQPARRRRSVLAGSVLAAGALAFGLLTTNGSAAPTTSASDGSGPACNQPASIDTGAIEAVPEKAGFAGRPVQAKVVRLTGAAGPVTERMPPADWRPATATPAELRYFGIPARPASNSAAYASWANEWVDHYSGFGLAVPCAPMTGQSNGPDERWSGIAAYGGGYTEAYGTTTFSLGSPCPDSKQPDSHSNWVGLGGVDGRSLIQNGFSSSHSNGVFPWYEMLNSTFDTYAIPLSFGGDPSNGLGHTFNIETLWDPSVNEADFYWHDLNTGQVFYLFVTEVQYASNPSRYYPASNFYDGYSSEAIDERVSYNGDFSALRNYGTDPWSNAYAKNTAGTVTPMRSLPHVGYTMYSSSSLISSVSAGPTADQFTDTWQGCGLPGF